MIPALSIRQPWADLVFKGKNIENRDWNTGYRGRFMVHATANALDSEYKAAEKWISDRGLAIVLPSKEDLPSGCILGTVFLDHITTTAPDFDDIQLWEHYQTWGNVHAKYWWHLSRPTLWTPNPKSCPGQIGWFFPTSV